MRLKRRLFTVARNLKLLEVDKQEFQLAYDEADSVLQNLQNDVILIKDGLLTHMKDSGNYFIVDEVYAITTTKKRAADNPRRVWQVQRKRRPTNPRTRNLGCTESARFESRAIARKKRREYARSKEPSD